MKKLLHKLVAISAATLISSLSASADVTVTQSTDSEGYTYNDGQLTRSDRNVTSIVLTGDQGNSQTISISNKGTGRYVWQNKVETPTTTFAPGETITVTSTSYGNSEWMHTYVYIDYNGDKTFTPEFEDDGYTVTENSELVTYNTYCTSGGDGPFYDSKGVKNETEKAGYALIGGPTPSLPSFTLPTKTGTYRVRYKVDWNSIDPIGTSSIATNGGEIIDFKITVATVETATVKIETPDSSQGTLEVTKKGDNTPLTSPAVLPVGTELEITAQAAKMSSYVLQGVYADDELISTADYFSYTVQGDVTLSAKFVSESDLKPVVTVETPTNGTIEVKDSAGNDVSGEVESGTEITITATPDKDYLFGSLSINGTAVEATDGKYTTTVTANTAISATFTEKYAHYTGSINGEYTTRAIKTFTLTGQNSNSQTYTIANVGTSRDVWQSQLDVVPTTTFSPGETITLTSTVNNTSTGNSWAHTYIYVDYNNDGIFTVGYDEAAHKITEKSELVTFNAYSTDSGTTFYNSNADKTYGGTAIAITAGSILPTFSLPADLKPDTYRVRYKLDWNSLDPYGASSIASNSGEIIDFLIKVVSDEHTVTINQADGGTIAVKNGDVAVESGATVTSGTTLTIEATPNEGYLLTAVKVNTTEIAAKDGKYTYLVGSDDVTITAEFTSKESFKPIVTIEQPTEGGTLSVSANEAEVASGNGVAYESTLTITATPASYAWKVLSVTANGEALTATEDGTYSLTITEATTIAATFEPKYTHNDATIKMESGQNTNRSVFGITLSNEKNVERGKISLTEISEGDTRALWQDMTAQSIKVCPGDELTISVKGMGWDLGEYLYIDWNNDGKFKIEKVDGETIELVSYNMDRINGAFYNSKGETVNRTNNTEGLIDGPYFYLPSFTVPSVEPGKYYARFKIDWASNDPYSAGTGCAGEIIDFVIEVVNYLPREVSVSVPETNSKYGSVKIKDHGDDKSVESSDNVTVVAEPSETLAFVEFMGWTLGDDDTNTIISKDAEFEYSAAAAANLVAHFGYKVFCKVSGSGTLTLTTANGAAKAPALRDDDDSAEAAETTSDRSVTAVDKDGASELFEAGSTIYVNAAVDNSTVDGISAISVYNKYTGEVTTYDYIGKENSERASATIELTLDEPKDVAVQYVDLATGVEDIAVDADNDAQYFNLSGVRVTGDLAPGLYIRRTATKAEKVIVK